MKGRWRRAKPAVRRLIRYVIQLGGILGLACLMASCSIANQDEIALRADQMEGFELIGQGWNVWQLDRGCIECAAQTWKHLLTGTIVKVRWVLFGSADQAEEAAITAGMWLSIPSEHGSYSNSPLGDLCWTLPMGYGAPEDRRTAGLSFCKGRFAVSVLGFVEEGPIDALLVESVARRMLENIENAAGCR